MRVEIEHNPLTPLAKLMVWVIVVSPVIYLLLVLLGI